MVFFQPNLVKPTYFFVHKVKILTFIYFVFSSKILKKKLEE